MKNATMMTIMPMSMCNTDAFVTHSPASASIA